MNLTVDQLRETLIYDPHTGAFTWAKRVSQRSKPGEVAGTLTAEGYVQIKVGEARHKAHRLAMLYVHGRWPAGLVDHINGDRSDNRIENLREATQSENQQNIHSAKRTNKSGFLGVHFHRGTAKWAASIRTDGRQRTIGYFDTPEEAHAAYLAAKRELHPFCTI